MIALFVMHCVQNAYILSFWILTYVQHDVNDL